MAANLQIIDICLLAHVDDLGEQGDCVAVDEHHARRLVRAGLGTVVITCDCAANRAAQSSTEE